MRKFLPLLAVFLLTFSLVVPLGYSEIRENVGYERGSGTLFSIGPLAFQGSLGTFSAGSSFMLPEAEAFIRNAPSSNCQVGWTVFNKDSGDEILRENLYSYSEALCTNLQTGDSVKLGLKTVVLPSDIPDGKYNAFIFLSGSNCVECADASWDFVVETNPNGGGDAPPNIVATNTLVQVSGTNIIGEVTLKNIGGPMTESSILEMQVRPESLGPLSFVGSQEVCNENTPENVHRSFMLGEGEEVTVKLTSQPATNGKYDVYFVSVRGCYPQNKARDPYPPGSEKLAGSVEVTGIKPTNPNPSTDPNIILAQDIILTTVDKKINANIYFKNTGADMKENWLVEMQPVRKGSTPLSFVSGQQVCDSTTPENVHKLFSIDSQDTLGITLSSTVEEEGLYDVYFYTRKKCFEDLTEEDKADLDSNFFADPFGKGKEQIVTNICVGDKDKCDEEQSKLPLLPIVLGVLGVGILIAGVILSSQKKG